MTTQPAMIVLKHTTKGIKLRVVTDIVNNRAFSVRRDHPKAVEAQIWMDKLMSFIRPVVKAGNYKGLTLATVYKAVIDLYGEDFMPAAKMLSSNASAPVRLLIL